MLFSHLFAVNTFQPEIDFINNIEFSGNSFVVGNTVWIETPDKPENLVRNFDLSLFNHLVIPDYNKCGGRRNQCDLVNLIAFKKQVGHFNDSLSPVFFAFEVSTKKDLFTAISQTQYFHYLEDGFCRDMINYSTVFDS